jgi:prepilin-type N-terminal cleavage/methylation domain-containing protein
MMREPRQRGFTLVEMLVVIAIIVVLMAILFPVFSRVRERARKMTCINNLSQLATALKRYQSDNSGRFPPAPVFVNGRYYGGFSALYPDYIDKTDILICPDDLAVRPVRAQAAQNLYSSYNGKAVDPAGGNWDFTEVYYNYHGYDFSGPPGGPVNSTGVDNGGLDEAGYFAVLMQEYNTEGLRRRAAPRLLNRSAPDNTIVTHCIYHRGGGSPANQTEVVLRLSGVSPTDASAKRSALEQDPDGNGPKIAPYISQR